MYHAICPKCDRQHQIDTETHVLVGIDTLCMSCISNDHLVFMQHNARKLKMSCVAGCICGFGGTS